MDKLMDYICDELETLEKKAQSGKLSMAEIQYGDTLAHFKKNLLKADEMMNEGYSMDGNSYRNRMYPYAMDNGNSYARGRTGNVRRDSMGRYSGDRYSRRGYSMDDDFVAELQELKSNAPNEQIRQEFQQFIERVQNKM